MSSAADPKPVRTRHAALPPLAAALWLLVALLVAAPAAAAAPDRGYELVSHADAGGATAHFPFFNATTLSSIANSEQLAASPDGERFLFVTSGPVPGTDATRSPTFYVGERAAGGWEQTYVGAPGHQVDTSQLADASEDLSRVLSWVDGAVGGLGGQLDPDDPGDRSDMYAREPDGSFTWVMRRPDAEDERMSYGGVSADGRTVLFAPNDVFGALYVNRPSGTEVAGIVEGEVMTSRLEHSNTTGRPRVSADGRRVVFTSARPDPASSTEDFIWVRKLDEGETVVVNEPQGVASSQLAARIRSFSDDGSAVFFTTAQQLLPADSVDDQVDLYRFDVEAEQLELVSGAAPGAASDGDSDSCDPSSYADGGDIVGCGVSAVKFSADGSTAYFISPEQLAPGAVADAPNLYVWRGGETRFVAELHPADADTGAGNARSLRADNDGHQPARVTDDGRRIAFESRMDTGDPGLAEIYVYDYESGDAACASCGALGPNADAQLRSPPDTHYPIFQGPSNNHGRNIANGGAQVYFQTVERLAGADTNGAMDVYEYDLGSGEHTLISSGKSPQGAFYFDNSTDGQDVFFATARTLAPAGQDLNSTIWKVYDARVGGGFPPAEVRAPCGEGDCRGMQDRPAFAPPGSLGLVGGGDVASQRMRLAVARPGARALRRAARTGRLVLRVRRNRAGVVRALVRARIGRRVRRVARGRTRVRAGGAARLRLRLSPPARRALARGRRLRVAVKVGSPGTRPRSMRLVLRRAGR